MIPLKPFIFIIQHSVTMSKYGYGSALNIRRAYATDILRYTSFRVSWGKMVDFSAFLLVDNLSEFNFATNVLSNETVILLNPVDIA